MPEAGTWARSVPHDTPCRILERQDLWDGPVYQVWIPSLETVARLREDQLSCDGQDSEPDPAWLTYLAAAARVSDALAGDLLLVPIEASLIPLPHQLLAFERALHRDPVRCLLADEVGLGKTMEAGLILCELKLRGRVRRTLVVAPKGLVTQWVAEMETHFGEEFRPLVPTDFPAFRRIAGGEEEAWRRGLAMQATTVPELDPILMARVEGGRPHG